MKVIHGNFVHTPSFGGLEILENVYVGIEQNGTIAFIEKDKDLVLSKYQICEHNVCEKYYDKNNTKFFVPGFVDLHIHSAQYSYLGNGTDIKLMEWLNRYAYPSEFKLQNHPKYTHNLYSKLIARLLVNGITTTQFFGTIDVESCLILAQIIQTYGVRGLIGKVCQDQYSPNNYCEDTRRSLMDTERFIQQILSFNSDLIHAVITPRFIPNCSNRLLSGLGALFETKYKDNPKVHIQSHLTESLDEIEFVTNTLYKGDSNVSDSLIFDKHNLLNDRSVMAHCVHCSASDLELLSSKGVGIAHCPLSNAFFAHGNLDVFELMHKYNINVGLGTDIAGGYSYSMLQCMRQSVITNRNIHKDNYDKFINYKHALYLATVGGAKCLKLDDTIGLFKVGMAFDCMVLDTDTNIDLFENNIHQIFEKIMNLADDRNIKAIWVKGKKLNPYATKSKL